MTARERWLELYFLSLLWLLCNFDIGMTLECIENGGIELNPLMAHLIELNIGLFIFLKLLLTMSGGLILFNHRKHTWAKVGMIATLLVYLMLTIYHVIGAVWLS